MVKTPRTRHSKTSREPVTIDLEAEAVRRDAESEQTATPADANEPAGHEAERERAESAAAGNETYVDDPVMAPDGEPRHGTEGDAADAASETSEPAADERPEMHVHEEAEPTAEREEAGDRDSRGGFGMALVAALAGAVIALAIGGALVWAGLVPSPERTAADPAAEGILQELADVQDELAQMRETGSAGPSAEALEQALSEPRQQIGELREMVNALQSAPSGGQSEELQALGQQLAELERRIASAAESAGGAGADGEMAGRLTDLEARAGEASEAAAAAQQATDANAQRLDDLSQQVAQLGGQVSQIGEQLAREDEGPRLALVVAASALRSAVERGAPFAGELDTFTALAPNEPGLEPLRPYSQTGIPTRAELAAEAPEVASRIAALASAPAPDAGFLDRLMASARSAVTVRPVGEAEGDSAAAIAARMEAAVQEGDYAQALAEYDALPDAAKEAASDFAEKLRARQAADDVLEKALSSALEPA